MPKVLITTVPFGDKNRLPIEQLDAAGIEYLVNPIGRKLREEELAEMVTDFDVLIAGTEPITERVMRRASRLKLISRVGIGLDSVDLLAAERRGIQVSYTPDAPAPAVAELTIGLMLSLLRSIHTVNARMHSGEWHRYFGRRIAEITIGVIGAGRIGGQVLDCLGGFGRPRILVNDLRPNLRPERDTAIEWVGKEDIYRSADVITLHVPLTAQTKNMIRREQLLQMKQDAIIINTSRGGIVNEHDLAQVLDTGHLAGAAIDVFEQEPYAGDLVRSDRCLLTSHMGSMSVDCRMRMEIEATEEAIRFLTGQMLQGLVPPDEYEVQRQGL
ncbi:phosphoglycerate dehydrogenase [Sulfuritalea hydrogenivorans]|uniref:Lactate dehydrogenase-like oxidoreductase n=1 Tax=Sulfuritalea hydrogenivorans sk43H TaxID=1223802 RepID=W0SJ89_9PROT|nr:phosphoglycerate dehydrogenase [Sulfuritalea hydrogenivorans]BAO31132.1 lactate dehydrogenase-like oxidoreductase [Sulfuritalea hydrogenivorans sk43H]